jgi:hypothetical protein
MVLILFNRPLFGNASWRNLRDEGNRHILYAAMKNLSNEEMNYIA